MNNTAMEKLPLEQSCWALNTIFAQPVVLFTKTVK